MQLHYAPGTIAVAVAVALEEARLPHEAVKVDFKSAEQTRAPYRSVNPKGRVPALVLEEGTVLTETGAILDYIAAIAPDVQLVPADPIAAARMRGVMYYLASTMHVNHAHGMRGSRWADRQESFDDMAAKVPQTMTESCRYIEDHALQGPFVMGDALTLADIYLFAVSCWLDGDGVDVAAFPKLARLVSLMEDRDSVKSVRMKGIL